MQAFGVKLFGAMDLRLLPFETGDLKPDEILVEIVCNGLCMSDYKIACLGEKHKKIPKDIKTNPIIIGHEMGCRILSVGEVWKDRYQTGQRVCIQPNLDIPGKECIPGYTYTSFGGCATYGIVPGEVIRAGCLLPFQGPFYMGALSEPLSCIIGAFNANYHTKGLHTNEHVMGTKYRGYMAILGGCGPMGLGIVDFALHGPNPPAVLCVTDINEDRIRHAEQLFSAEASRNGVKLYFLNRPDTNALTALALDGFDDIFVLSASAYLLEQASAVLAADGCINFFAGPTDKDFAARLNYYNVHYRRAHVVGTSGASLQDMKDAILYAEKKQLNPAAMVTHIGGLNCAAGAIERLPQIPGGKKLIYNSLTMPLTAIEDLEELGNDNPFLNRIAGVCKENGNMWCAEAEEMILQYANKKE